MKRLAALWLCTCSALLAQGTLSLEQISKDQQIWPTEVMVVIDHKVPVTENGKTRWKKVGPGKTYTLVSINEKEVTVDGQGTALAFKADETDLIARAEQIKAQRDAPPPAQAPAAATPMDPPNSGPRMVAVDSFSDGPSSNPAAPSEQGGGNVMARKLSGLLVRPNNGTLQPYDSSKLSNKKYIAVYFAAGWCGHCRHFTPSFVQWYARSKTVSNDFEVVFVSDDKDEGAMQSFMVNERMEWPAIAFRWRENNPLAKYGGRGIPNIVILDSSGAVVSSSYDGNQYLGAGKPIDQMTDMLNRK